MKKIEFGFVTEKDREESHLDKPDPRGRRLDNQVNHNRPLFSATLLYFAVVRQLNFAAGQTITSSRLCVFHTWCTFSIRRLIRDR